VAPPPPQVVPPPPPAPVADSPRHSAAPAIEPLPLAEAFAALLAAEQKQPARSHATAVPALPEHLIEDLVEEVSRRVLTRLSDTVTRETVADIVPKLAERIVQEEIARIKSSIK
jgi:hypothetical protein